MNKGIMALIAVTLCIAVCGASTKDWTNHKGKIKFKIGSKKGFRKAEGQKRPMMLFFTASW